MFKIEIFEADNAAGLQREVNTWLSERHSIEIVQVVQSESRDPADSRMSLHMTFLWREKTGPLGIAEKLAIQAQKQKERQSAANPPGAE